MLTAVNHNLSLVALHCFPHLLSSNQKCAHPFLTVVQRRTTGVRRSIERLRGVLRHADPPAIMPVEAEEEVARLLVIVCVWTFESTCLSVINNIVSV
jgi:hypothetical protein